MSARENGQEWDIEKEQDSRGKINLCQGLERSKHMSIWKQTSSELRNMSEEEGKSIQCLMLTRKKCVMFKGT